jgi:hypothetical protein
LSVFSWHFVITPCGDQTALVGVTLPLRKMAI